MTLSFSQKINDAPTYFVEKIWWGLLQYKIATFTDCNSYQKQHISKFNECWPMEAPGELKPINPKIHTIRVDEQDQWRLGMPIHFAINNRSKNRFQFAPVVPVKGVQRIEIMFKKGKASIYIDNQKLNRRWYDQLAVNDGFENWTSMAIYFMQNAKPHETGGYIFKGKIIHWTNLKY